MIPFGAWHPDKESSNAPICLTARNCAPATAGFAPLKSLAPASLALASKCLGAGVVLSEGGNAVTFAGTSATLHRLIGNGVWSDVSRTTGGAYHASSSERWQFAFSGGLVVALNQLDDPQKYLIGTSTDFEALGGSPPRARYVTTVRDFVVLGATVGSERTIAWSGLAQPEFWTPGTQSCDTQTFQNGGPVRGLVGGEVGYVFQAEAVTRMTFVPGSEAIFQFDEVEGGRGLAAPYSIVKIGNMAYYLTADGVYRFSLGAASAEPLGVGKWAKGFMADVKASSLFTVQAAVDPVNKRILFAYNSSDFSGAALNRVLIYDWSLDEATTADITTTAMSQLLTPGVSLDALGAFGTIDTLPFSLDSPVWKGGTPLLGLFGTDNKLAFLTGANMAATFVTADMERPSRALIRGSRPHIDTRAVLVEIGAREALGDVVTFGAAEAMADTGVVPAWASGFLARARVTVPAGSAWSKMTGLTTDVSEMGAR